MGPCLYTYGTCPDNSNNIPKPLSSLIPSINKTPHQHLPFSLDLPLSISRNSFLAHKTLSFSPNLLIIFSFSQAPRQSNQEFTSTCMKFGEFLSLSLSFSFQSFVLSLFILIFCSLAFGHRFWL